MNTTYQLARESRDSQPLVELVHLLDADLGRRYGELQTQYSKFNSLASVDAAVIAYDGNSAAGCGCFRQFDASTVEIKRMFVRREHRGSGAARLVLDELERWAAESGYSRAILETGAKQVEAIRFYTKSGYYKIENYGQYAGMENSVCMEKRLSEGDIAAR